MFENTLLIIKADYMHKRKILLKYLLRRGFQIQGQRHLSFTVEEAAEFYSDLVDTPYFMMQVMLLSKGNSEAYILAKKNAVEDMLNILVCYFGSSIEMDRYIHITTCSRKTQREISYIFPNYIHESIFPLEQIKFCTKAHVIGPMIHELYDIVTQKDDKDANKTWKMKLAEALESSHAGLPQISNVCNYSPSLNMLGKAVQTKATSFKPIRLHPGAGTGSTATLKSHVISYTTQATTFDSSSSSCISCTSFESIETCMRQSYRKVPLVDLVKAKTAPLEICGSERELQKIEMGEEKRIEMEMLEEAETKSIGEEESTHEQDVFSIEISSASSMEISSGEGAAVEDSVGKELVAGESIVVEPTASAAAIEDTNAIEARAEKSAVALDVIGEDVTAGIVTEEVVGYESPSVGNIGEEPADENPIVEQPVTKGLITEEPVAEKQVVAVPSAVLSEPVTTDGDHAFNEENQIPQEVTEQELAE
uniref:Nucleoside diphosphate kinase-like domain-containing protein n=1 Tax=Glossina palpalis gambiensis TaxID=67801 RepID=A0A1B0BME9_9MUSC